MDPRRRAPFRRLLAPVLLALLLGVPPAGAGEGPGGALPSGGWGLLHVRSAQEGGAGAWAVAIGADTYASRGLVSGYDVARTSEAESATYGLAEHLDLRASLSMASEREVLLATGDASFATGAPAAEVGLTAARVRLGPIQTGVELAIAGRFPSLAAVEGKNALIPSGRLLASAPLGGYGWFHLNVGLEGAPASGGPTAPAGDPPYVARAVWGPTLGADVPWGIALEAPAREVRGFVEYAGRFEPSVGWGRSAQALSLGMRGGLPSGPWAQAGVDLGTASSDRAPDGGLFRRSPPWRALLTLGVSFSPSEARRLRVVERRPPLEPDEGGIEGRVFDTETGEGLGGAVVFFPGRDLPLFAAAPETGGLWAPGLPTGALEAVFSKDGYSVAYRTFDLAPGVPARAEVGLDPLSSRETRPPASGGDLYGRVVGEDGRGLAALVVVDGAVTAAVPTEIGSGDYRMHLPEGPHEVTAVAEGYLLAGPPLRIDLPEGGTLSLPIALEPHLPFRTLVGGKRGEGGPGRVTAATPLVAIRTHREEASPAPVPPRSVEELRRRWPAQSAAIEGEAYERGREEEERSWGEEGAPAPAPPTTVAELEARYPEWVAEFRRRRATAPAEEKAIRSVAELERRYPDLVAEIREEQEAEAPPSPTAPPLVPSLPEGKGPLVEAAARYDPDRRKIVLSAPLQFLAAGAEVLPQSNPLLDAVAQVMRRRPEMNVAVEGYTDDQGGDAFNIQLSQLRADRVRLALISRGIVPGRLRAVGYGKWNPIVPNADEAARALNRRVEFSVVSGP